MAKRKKRIRLNEPIYRVMGWDPGRFNCALAIYGPEGLEDTDVIEGVGDGDLNLAIPIFSEHIDKQLQWYKPERCGIERYHQRAGSSFVGNMEAVNIMIGILLTKCADRNIPAYIVTPAVHKKWAGKNFRATKRSGKLCMHTCPEFIHLLTEHEADAANVAKYCGLEIFTS